MKRLLFTMVVCALAAGAAMADISFNPDEYDPGIYLLDVTATGSWSQKMWIKPWEGFGAPTTYQFRICTNPADSDGPQSFEPVGFTIVGYTPSPSDTPWTVDYGPHLGVDNAMMWASGVNPATSQGEFITLQFLQGTVSSYPNPYNSTWSNTPEFIVQMQAYQGETRKANVELYFDGTDWQNPDSDSIVDYPIRIAQASGYWHANGLDWACPEWTLAEPVPVPGAVLLGVLGLSVAGVKLRRRA